MGTTDPPAVPELPTRDLNRLLAFQQALLDRMKAAYTATREELLDRYLERYNDDGSKTFVVRDGDLGKIATATLNEQTDKPYVEDEAAFLAWVEDHAPTEVVKKVRDTYLKSLFDKGVKLTGDGVIHTKTGEVIPGLAVQKAGDPTKFTFSFERDGEHSAKDDVLTLAMRQSVPALLGVEAGED